MSINDGTFGDFANELQDEDQLDAHPVPGIEIGYDTQRDCGSGSYAEDGRREVREDRPIMDGEHMLGSAAMYGPTEIGDSVGAVKQAVAKAAQAVQKAVVAKKTAPPRVAAAHAALAHRAVAEAEHAFASAPYAQGGAVEIGSHYPTQGASELGFGGFDDDALGAMTSQERAYMDMKFAQIQGEIESLSRGMATGPTVAARRRALAQRPQGPVNVLGSHYPTQGASELGDDSLSQPFETFMIEPHRIGDDEMGSHYPTQGASELGSHYPTQGATELGAGEDTLGDDSLAEPFESFMVEPHRIGCEEVGAAAAADRPGYELGSAAMYGPTEIGSHYPTQGATELGAMYPTNGLSVMGAGYYPGEGASEIGEAQVKAAVIKVVEKARDNRQPAPPMKAVDVDAPLEEGDDDFLTNIVLGATVDAPGASEPFPLLSQLLLRAGANVEPRVVRVDTEESYKQFRTAHSPEMSKLSDLTARLEAHIADPNAHELDSTDIDDDIEDLVHLGEEAKAVEAQKRVELWMPKRFEGKIEAWKEDGMVCASIALPGKDGCVRICTSFEPVSKCVEEILRHASETRDGMAVVGVLPAMGCVLGAGTVMKEMAAAAPAILARPEAKMKMPFVVRIEPKTSPNLAALVMLAAGAKMGNEQAASEWQKLASMSAPAVKLAMLEALEVAKAATAE